MTTKRLGLLALIVLSVGTGCSDVSTVVSPDAEVLFARKPGGDKATDNKSCENPTSGSPTRNAPKEKNQCEGGSSAITFTVANAILHIGVQYVGADCNTTGVMAQAEEAGPFTLCADTSVKLGVAPGYNVLIAFGYDNNERLVSGVSEGGSCVSAGQLPGEQVWIWACNVLATGTVITLDAS